MEKRITGYTDVYGIIATPIRHSISPLMHNTAFEALGMDAVYTAFDTPPEKFAAGVEGLKALGVKGFNISMPYKRAVMDHLDALSPAARLCKAVNTAVREADGSYTGHLTDGIGFFMALREEGLDIAGRKLVLFGKGGAAAAIGVQAALEGAREVVIFNRSDAGELARLIGTNTACGARALALSDREALRRELSDCDLAVNATNVGMGELAGQCLVPDSSYLNPGCFAADVIYHPPRTAFLQMAGEAGCRTMNGLGMLLFQGAEAFRLWTGRQMPVQAVKAAVFSGL